MKKKQLIYEVKVWKRLLEFILDENIIQKNELSEILKNGYKNIDLELIEVFQNRFLKVDNMISFLRNELAELDGMINSSGQVENFQGQIENKLIEIRYNVAVTESEFIRLKTDFLLYLAEISEQP